MQARWYRGGPIGPCSGTDPPPVPFSEPGTDLDEQRIEDSPVQRHDSMVNPPIEGLLEAADSKFRLVTVSAKRARQINAYFGQLGEGLGASIPPQITSTSRKPLSISFEELSAGKIEAIEPPDEPEEVDALLASIDAEMAEHLGDELPEGDVTVTDGAEGA